MSYEGFEQHICKNGHRFDVPCSYSGGEDNLCPFCNAPSVFCNSVDQTNGGDQGIILDWSFCMLTPEKTETCNLGHVHAIEQATYRIPSRSELRKHRVYHEN